jgi:sphinganine-1-phosphate aldolase
LLLLVVVAHFWQWLGSLNLKASAKRLGVVFLNKAFSIESKMKAGLLKLRQSVHEAKHTSIQPVYDSLPHLSDGQIKERLEEILRLDSRREKIGRDGGNYYFSAKDGHREFVESMASRFLYTNIMHFDSCCGAQLLENELINFFGKLLHAPKSFVGTCTFGGTESLLLAMLSYRELGLRQGIKDPEIVCFESAHVGFFKAAFYFKINLRVAPIDEKTGEGDVDQLMSLVNENTVAIILSGGTYAHGVVDRVAEVNQRIKDTNIWIHVDSCLGGFMSVCSSLRKDGRISTIDFRLSRVGTISIDPHKYGEGPKGCSIIIYHDEEIKKAGIFVKNDWNGGIYATPALPGSRGAAPFVGAWVSMVRMGMEGILKTYDELVETRENLLRDLRSIPEIEVIGRCNSGVVSFGTKKSSGISIFGLNEELKAFNWKLSLMQRPFCIHVTISRNNKDQLPQMKSDLLKCIEKMRQKPNTGKDTMYAVLYGSLVKLPDADMIDDALKTAIVEINRLHVDQSQ